VNENVAFGLRVKPRALRPSREEIHDRVERLLKLVQLDWMGDRLPSQLSGGQRQRVALARALAVEPKVLLLDEPFGALDANVRKELRRWLRRLHDEIHVTSIFVTHDVEEALEVADGIVVMNEGRIEQAGTPDHVYEQPATAFVYRFLGSANVIPSSNAMAAQLSAAPNGGADATPLFVRPHDFELFNDSGHPGAVEARISALRCVGSVIRLELQQTGSGQTLEAETDRHAVRTLNLAVGGTVFIRPRAVKTYPASAQMCENTRVNP
jgi:sulfate transport system ATP-binding protein